jgi:hypothetical protein
MKEVPSLKTLKEYLGEMSNVILKLDSWIYWITPSGLKVILYIKWNHIELKPIYIIRVNL